MTLRRFAPIVAIGLLALALAGCSNRATALMDDYNAGFDAGTGLTADPAHKCGHLTQQRYDDDGGTTVDSADEARAFWVACVDAALGRDDPMTSHEISKWLDEEDEAAEGP